MFTDGDWIESKDQSDVGIRLIQTGNIGVGQYLEKEDRKKYISEETFRTLNCTEVYSGDILISRLPEPVGRGCIIPEKDERMITAVDCTICRVNESILDKRYFCYYLQSSAYYNQLEQSVTGTTRKRISRKNLGAVEITVPEKENQIKIINVLDKVSVVIEARKDELQKLDELIKSRFVEMFGTVKENPYNFPTATLKEVCHKITDGKHGGCEQEANSGYYYIGAREIYDGAIHYDTAPQITYADFTKDYRRCNIEQGDMVIVNTGATIGKSAIAVSSLTERTLLQKSVALLKVKTDMVSAEFLRYCYMANPSMYMVKSASAQPNLLLSKMNATVIYLPPRELQEQFAAFVAQTDKSKLFVNAYFILIFCCLRCIINTSVKSKLSNDKGEAL